MIFNAKILWKTIKFIFLKKIYFLFILYVKIKKRRIYE